MKALLGGMALTLSATTCAVPETQALDAGGIQVEA
jgi:hypothetical protein